MSKFSVPMEFYNPKNMVANKQEFEDRHWSLGVSFFLVLFENIFLNLCLNCNLRKIFQLLVPKKLFGVTRS